MAKLDIRNKAFERQLQKYLKVSTKTGTKEIRTVALDVLKGVMRKSPVDNGTFKGNWNVGLNNIDSSVNENFKSDSKFGSFNAEKFSEGSSVISGFKSGQSINISNALPYANKLEFTSHSPQSTGMVRRTPSKVILSPSSKG